MRCIESRFGRSAVDDTGGSGSSGDRGHGERIERHAPKRVVERVGDEELVSDPCETTDAAEAGIDADAVDVLHRPCVWCSRDGLHLTGSEIQGA